MDGYLYPLGIIVGCSVVGAMLFAIKRQIVAPRTGEVIYLGLALVCVAVAVAAILRFRQTYDASMLNWRLRRRQRKTSSALSKLEL